MREIASFDADNASIFAEIYKICAENKGKFILINPSAEIKEALSNVYLEDVIPIADNIEKAVNIIKEEFNQ